VAIGGFDPEHDPVSRLKEDPSFWQLGGERVAFPYPRVWADVTSLAKDETVTLAPYLVVELIDVRPMPERVNYVVSTRGGNAGIIRHFAVTLSPDREGGMNTPPMPQGEKINSAVGAGGDAKSEINIPPMPQYDRSEVQQAIEKQQEAVQEYAYPPPEQLEAPGEVGGGERIIFYAPQYTSETAALEGWPPSNEKVYPFVTLTPGGREVLLLSVTMLPEYFYHFRVGVLYSYRGRQGVAWSEEFVAAVPLEATVWMETEGSSRLQKFGDLQEFEDRIIIREDGARITPANSF
jgi:hypothetical protein